MKTAPGISTQKRRKWLPCSFSAGRRSRRHFGLPTRCRVIDRSTRRKWRPADGMWCVPRPPGKMGIDYFQFSDSLPWSPTTFTPQGRAFKHFFSSESKKTARHVLATKMKVRVTFTRALADFHCNPSHFFLFVEMNPLDDLMVIRCSQQQIRPFNDDITLLICINLHKFA